MRFFALSTFFLAASAIASPLQSPKVEGVVVADEAVVAREVEAPVLVKKDAASELSDDLGRLLGDVVYDIEGILNAFGINSTEFFINVGLAPPADTHGNFVDAARLITDIIKDLVPIAIRFGINLLTFITGIL